MSDEALERNKQTAMAFYALAFNEGRPREAVERYVGDDYIQHNPHVASGKQGFIDYFETLARDYPVKQVNFIRTIAEGDLVVVHTHQTWEGFDDYASMDIFRFDAAGRIVEHWDVLQTVPKEMAHENSMF